MAKYHQNLKYHNDDTEKHKITSEEIEFLKSLQTELNTQDHISQADPRFWVIKGTEKIYHVDEADGFELFDRDACEVLAHDTEELFEYIRDNLLDEINENRNEKEKYGIAYDESVFGSNTIVLTHYDEDWEDTVEDRLEDIDEIRDWLSENGYDYEVISYQYVPKIYENTMFLTQIDAENHLKSNDYHYSEDAHTYAMTAWRSPRVEKLVKILQSVDFDKLI